MKTSVLVLSFLISFFISSSVWASGVKCSLYMGYNIAEYAYPVSTCRLDVEYSEDVLIKSCLMKGKNKSGDSIVVRVSQIGSDNDEGVQVETRAIRIQSGKYINNRLKWFSSISYLHAQNDSYEGLSSPVLEGMTLKCIDL